MRVISGKYKGRILQGFDIDGTRPTMDRVKESLFGMIQNKVNESICLDLFAGSGALGIEALSNGASFCYFVDKNKIAINTLKNNLNNINNYEIICDDYKCALNKLKMKKFDIIFLDPPYKLNLINDCVDFIFKNDMLNMDGIIVCEAENEELDDLYNVIKDKKYGSKRIRIYKN